MRLLRLVDAEEVVGAIPGTPENEVTRNLVRERDFWGAYLIEPPDWGIIKAQMPDSTQEQGSIAYLFPKWKIWIQSRKPESTEDRCKHESFVAVLANGGHFEKRPIIQDRSKQVHDGKHRLFAAYDLVSEGTLDTPIEVFWNDSP